jgi:hypothetical protein
MEGATSYQTAATRSGVPGSAKAPGVVAERTTTGLSFSVLRTARSLSGQLYEQYVHPSLAMPSVEAYIKFMSENWPRYMDAHGGYAAVLSGAMDNQRALAVAERQRSQTVASIRTGLLPIAGPDACLEVDFSEQTIRRAIKIAAQLGTFPAPTNAAEDWRLCMHFESSITLWAFEMMSLLVVTSTRPRLAHGVMDTVFSYLRDSALLAHRSVRKALKLREAQTEPEGAWLPFSATLDEEEEHKLATWSEYLPASGEPKA